MRTAPVSLRGPRLWILLAAILYALGAQPCAHAQNHLPPGSVGKITGDDISVEGGVFPTSVKGATSLFVSSGSVLTIHSGTAELALVNGATVDACGPAKFTVLESGGAFTLALNFGRLRVRAGSGAAIRVFTPFIVANPISISEIGTDFTIGIDVKDSVCVYAGEGAATLEQQFGGQNLVVPTTSEFVLAGERLNPTEAPVGSCRCTYSEPPPRNAGAGVTTATSNGPPGNSPNQGGSNGGSNAGSSAGSGSSAAATPNGPGADTTTSPGASSSPAPSPSGAPAEASGQAPPAAPGQPNAGAPAQSATQTTSPGANQPPAEQPAQPAQGSAQTATTPPSDAAPNPPASQGVAIDLGRAATPPPAATTSNASSPAGANAPGASPVPAKQEPPSAPAAADNTPAFAGNLNQTPPTGAAVAAGGAPTPPQIQDSQYKAAPSPLSYQAPPPAIEEGQVVNVQAQPDQGFMVDGHVQGKPGAATKPAKSKGNAARTTSTGSAGRAASPAPAGTTAPATKTATATPPAAAAAKPRKPYQAPGTGFWSKFRKLFSKPAPAPKPEAQP